MPPELAGGCRDPGAQRGSVGHVERAARRLARPSPSRTRRPRTPRRRCARRSRRSPLPRRSASATARPMPRLPPVTIPHSPACREARGWPDHRCPYYSARRVAEMRSSDIATRSPFRVTAVSKARVRRLRAPEAQRIPGLGRVVWINGDVLAAEALSGRSHRDCLRLRHILHHEARRRSGGKPDVL